MIQDAGSHAADLVSKYDQVGGSGEHPVYTVSDWRDAVAAGKTRLGYWEWAAARIDEAYEDETRLQMMM
jgi:hypothetical protein